MFVGLYIRYDEQALMCQENKLFVAYTAQLTGGFDEALLNVTKKHKEIAHGSNLEKNNNMIKVTVWTG